MDRIDVKILERLQVDGRATLAELADIVGLSATPCQRRIKNLEEEGVIRGYRADLDRAKVGLGVTAFVLIDMMQHTEADTRRFAEAVRAIPEVVSCHALAGNHDFLLEVVIPDLPAYADLMLARLGGLPGVKNIASCFSLAHVKEPDRLPLAPPSASRSGR